MEFGIPKEVDKLEKRVGLTPAGTLVLTKAGHNVYIEGGAGAEAGFSDEEYERSGGKIVYSAAEAYGRADVVAKVLPPDDSEYKLLRNKQIIFSFLHLSIASPGLIKTFVENEITAIAYEMIEREDGLLPVLFPISQIAGRLAPIIAGQLLSTTGGGRGILLNGIPGVPPATVVIIGGGVLGFNAAKSFLGAGARVIVLARRVSRLRYMDDMLKGQLTTMLFNEYTLKEAIPNADVLVGCVQITGRRTPVLISREHVQSMRKRSVIIDFSISSGGCVSTSRPTNLRNQTFVEDGIIHYCVPNVTASVARTASHALNNASLPYLLSIAKNGLSGAMQERPALACGVNLFEGKLSNSDVAVALGRKIEVELLDGVL